MKMVLLQYLCRKKGKVHIKKLFHNFESGFYQKKNPEKSMENTGAFTVSSKIRGTKPIFKSLT